jgi:uncharacterized CHY-type Zn-finger protein
MAKVIKKPTAVPTKRTRAVKKAPHVRVLCPHCGKNVTVQQPMRYQLSLPCPVCKVPIGAHLIEAAAQQQGQEGGETEAGAGESAAAE